MKKITNWQPDVNKSVFRLTYIEGELKKVELEKVDPLHEGLTAEEAFNSSRKQCIEKTLTILEEKKGTDLAIDDKAKIEDEAVSLRALLADINPKKLGV